MRLKRDNTSLKDLRESNPRAQTGFPAILSGYARLREETVASGTVSSQYPAQPRVRRSRKRVVGLSTGVVLAAAAAAVAAVLLLGGGNANLSPTPALAAAAAKKAALDTSTAARSGVIETELLIDGEAQVANKISWNGSDLSLEVQNDEQRQIRYVDGLYYETYGYSVGIAPGDISHADQWIHVTGYDHGGGGSSGTSASEEGTPANEEATPAKWLSAARSDLAGDGLIELVSGAQGYTRTGNADGSVSYAANTTVAAIQSEDWSLSGLPLASQPSFKVKDPQTPVAIVVTVGADGLIEQLRLDWTLDIPGEASSWSYTTTYSELGTAPAITAPDPAHTTTTDTRFPTSDPGPM